jgi:hypothetical protein
MPKGIIHIALTIYQYLMPGLTLIYLIIIPLIVKQQYSNSLFVDKFVQSVLFIYLSVGYWFIAFKIKKRIDYDHTYGFRMNKDVVTFSGIFVSGVASGALLMVLTYWSMITFAPYFHNELIIVLSGVNGFVYGLLVWCEYFFLPEI